MPEQVCTIHSYAPSTVVQDSGNRLASTETTVVLELSVRAGISNGSEIAEATLQYNLKQQSPLLIAINITHIRSLLPKIPDAIAVNQENG